MHWSDLAGDEGGRRGGGGPGRRAGDAGGAPESSVGATRRALIPPFSKGGEMHQRAVWEQQHWLGSLKNLTIGLIWLVTRGEVWGGWAREAGKGGEGGGGHQRAVWEQQGVHWFHLLGSLKNLTIGLIWLVTGGGGVGGGGPGRRARGGGGGGGTREQCGSNKACTGFSFWAPLKT